MGAFDRFYNKETLIRKDMEIDNDLYDSLKKISKTKYNTSTNMLINACIENLLKNKNINIEMHTKQDKYSSTKHTVLIMESFMKELNSLKNRSGISESKLVNIAIKNAISDYKLK